VAVSADVSGYTIGPILKGQAVQDCSFPTFRDNISVQFSWVKQSWSAGPFKMGPVVSPETSVKKTIIVRYVKSQKSADLMYTAVEAATVTNLQHSKKL
jgi:hypothetical protein